MAVKRKVQFVFGNQIPFPKPERARDGWAALSKGVCVKRMGGIVRICAYFYKENVLMLLETLKSRRKEKNTC